MEDLIHLTDLTNLPLSSNQKRLWIISQQDKFNPAYNILLTYHLEGEINIDIFNRSMGLLFDRQHTMFSVFKQKDGSPYVEIIPRPVVVEFIDFSGLPLPTRRDEILFFAGEHSRKCFDIETGPLYRLYLLKEDEKNYFFCATVHHLIFDGFSRRIFVQEFSGIYSNLILGGNEQSEPLKFHSYDFASIEKEALSPENEKDLIEYWEENLKECKPELKFPYDFPRSNNHSGLGCREPFQISQECSHKLRMLSIESNTSLFNTLLSILGILFHKYTGENDICIGIPVSNRRSSPSFKIFGLFVNTLPIRLLINEGNMLIEHISYSTEVFKKALKHSQLPFEKIVEVLKPERVSGLNPFFQISFSWINNFTASMDLGGITGKRVTVTNGTSPFDITFYMWENGNIIEGEIEYNIDVLKRDTIVRFKDNFAYLLQSVSENPGKRISEISIISEYDRKKLAEFNSTDVEISECLIQNFFEKQSTKQPSSIAVMSGDSRLTYKELDEKSSQIANHLLKFGVKGGDAVGICLERSVEMVVSVLGVLKSGCCYVPMDPSFPDDRIKYTFEDSGAKVLITHSSLKNKFIQFTGAPIVLIDSDKLTISRNSKVKPELRIDNQSLAYIIYTSGSTGKPKGVKVHHQAVVNFLNSMLKRPGFTKEDRLLGVTTLSFDISVLELFLPLSSGAELVIAEIDDILDGQKLSNLLIKNDITVMQATPSTWNILLSSGWNGKNNMKALCGGEAIPSSLVKDLLPKVESLWNMYGPTETTVWSTCVQLTDLISPILVGTPIDNTRVYIMDKNNIQLPVGVTGEVCIGGLGVSKGYHNRLDLTAEKFIKFGNGETIYKTGDLGRFLSDGNIELFGRADNQIKLRGFRIEPDEIESLLSQLPYVKEAVVKLNSFGQNDQRLVAFLNVNDNFKESSEEIQEYLVNKLPTYMVPSFFQVSDGFPRLPNGKINKKALLYEIKESDQKQEIDLESLTDTQRKLMAIWQDILKVRTINPSDNFFNVGGNSMLAISLMNKIKEQIGIVLNFKDIIAHPSIMLISVFIDNHSEHKDEIINLVHLTETRNLPLTANQRRLWLISKLHPDTPSYIIPNTFKLRGYLNRKIFQKSLEIIFNRHHIIFSVIKDVNDEPCCDIVPAPINISFIDYSEVPEDKKTEKVKEKFNEDSRKIFDLGKGPIYRITLIQTGSEEYYLRMSIHHIVFDAWSWSVLAKELNEVYNSLIAGREFVLNNIEFQQYDYAQWEKSTAGSYNEKELKDFWKENLKDSSSVLNFPYDFPRVEQSSGRCKYETIKISPELTAKLKKISIDENSSLFSIMLSVFGIQMHKYSGEDDLNIGLPVAYRPYSKLENIFGMFVNTVVVRLKYSTESTFRNLIHQTSDAALDAITHQDLPFEKTVEVVNPVRSSNANPLFQVGFTWQNFVDRPLRMDGIQCERIKGDEGSSIFDISFYMWENGSQIEGEIDYNVDILRRDTIIRLKTNFIDLLQSLTENPDHPVSEISLLSEDDKKKIEEFNDTDCPYEHSLCIHHKFEKQAKENPYLPALLVKDKTLSYKELDDHANRMANYLIKRGTKVEDKIGICADRSLEMMISIFGALKAGAAYLPLSPDTPTERLRSIINDANPKLLLIEKSSASNIPEECEIVFIDDILQKPLSENSSNPEVKMSSRNLAYVLYTSGSTGTPKGVMIEHHSVLNRLGWMQKAYPIDKTDTLLQKTPITFDVSVWELFWWSFNGSKLVMLPKGGEKDPEILVDYIADFGITTIHFVPSMFATFFETIVIRKLCGKLECMNRIFLSGEALPLTLVRDFNEMRKSFFLPDLINLYGPTEATVDVSYYDCPRENIKNVYIGKPIDNTKLFVVNGKNIIQPIGVPGELVITGVNLARGYLNRPELTTEKFFNFKISNEQKIRAYHTGDLVKLTSEGEIDYLGRMDNQVKIRGFRIELGDIEAKILEHPMVTHCAIIVIEKGKYKYLVAYVCLKPGCEIEANKLRNYLSGKLPEYMVPPYIVFLETLPLTNSGKLNRKSLPAPDSIMERGALATPSNKTEEILLNLWKDLLKTEKISVNDNFFDAGGNSLLAINLANLISREFNIPLKALMLFEFPSIKAQSEYLSGKKGVDFSVKNTEIDKKTKNRKNVSFKRFHG